MHRADGAFKSLGCQIRTYCDRPGGGDEIRGLVREYRNVLAGHPLLQSLDRRCQFARRREQQLAPQQLAGQVLGIASQVGDIAGGVPNVHQGLSNVEVLGDLVDISRVQPVVGRFGQDGMELACG